MVIPIHYGTEGELHTDFLAESPGNDFVLEFLVVFFVPVFLLNQFVFQLLQGLFEILLIIGLLLLFLSFFLLLLRLRLFFWFRLLFLFLSLLEDIVGIVRLLIIFSEFLFENRRVLGVLDYSFRHCSHNKRQLERVLRVVGVDDVVVDWQVDFIRLGNFKLINHGTVFIEFVRFLHWRL